MRTLSLVTFDWSDEKNAELKIERNISFEEIVVCINENRIVDVLKHPDRDKYPDQRIYVIWYRNYAYAVPFVRDEKREVIFLKTIYPSRLYTRRYRKEVESDEKEHA